MKNESMMKLVAGVLFVYPECTQQLVIQWVEEQIKQGKTIENLYQKFSAGYLRFSVANGVLVVEEHSLAVLSSLSLLVE